nr:7TM GPCR domain containing protein [Haemonchus contortus]
MYVCITVVILSLKGALLNNETSFMDLLAGSIVNVSISVNFFVYYSISKEYRAIFDKVLGIGHIKAMLKRSMPAVVRRVNSLVKSFTSTDYSGRSKLGTSSSLSCVSTLLNK